MDGGDIHYDRGHKKTSFEKGNNDVSLGHNKLKHPLTSIKGHIQQEAAYIGYTLGWMCTFRSYQQRDGN